MGRKTATLYSSRQPASLTCNVLLCWRLQAYLLERLGDVQAALGIFCGAAERANRRLVARILDGSLPAHCLPTPAQGRRSRARAPLTLLPIICASFVFHTWQITHRPAREHSLDTENSVKFAVQ